MFTRPTLRARWIRHWGLAWLLLALCSAPAWAISDAFVRPAELDPDVRFWTRVYTEVTTNAGLIHDERYLGVVYEAISFPEESSPEQRSRRVQAVKEKYQGILRHLAQTNGVADSADEKRVRALWPENTSARAFAEAAEHVRFQLGQADRFREGLIRAGAYEAHIADTLSKMGLPSELAALPHVESSFNPAAYSRAGAAGLWQFMRSTGRRYMRIDSVVDERLDPYRSTVAAAQLLQFNYDLLGTWPLALTAYNHGAAGMRRAKDKQGTDDIVTIIRKHQSRTFGFASRNYYVAFLAALDVERDADKYFGPLQRMTEPKVRSYSLPAYLPVSSLEQVFGVDAAALRTYNPSLTSAVWNGDRYVPRGFEFRVPEARLPADDPQVRLASLGPGERFDAQKADRIYRVKRGDSLSRIAEAHGTTPSVLMRLNGLDSAHRIRQGQVLHMPGSEPRPVLVASAPTISTTPAVATTTVVASAPVHAAVRPTPTPVSCCAQPAQPPADIYVVKRGDSLSEIARRVGLAEKDLMDLNKMRDRDFVYEGQRLRLANTAPAETPLPAGIVTVTALADLEAQPEEIIATDREIARAEAAEPVSEAQAEAVGPTLVPGAETAGSADPSDYTVADNRTIEVQAAETLGHYADWLEVRASRLRELNHMRYGTPVVIGHRIKLDLTIVHAEEFEQRRREYHRRLQEEFFATNRIVGTETHIVRRGESLWVIAQKYQDIPIWLLRQYNPDIDFGDVRPSTELVLPVIETTVQESGAPTAP